MKGNRIVLALYILFLAAGITGLVTLNKAELHLFLNGVNTEILASPTTGEIQLTSSFHNHIHDLFFQGVTFLGEWFPFLIIGIIMLFKLGYGLGALAAQGLSTVIIQTIKRTVCAPRPRKFFAENFPDLLLPVPENFTPHWTHSFPSGHTSCIFSLLVFMILMTKNQYLKVFYLLLAILVGYSRIYLSQHFTLDVVVGSFIGTVCAAIFWYALPQDKKWYQYSTFGHIFHRGSAR